MRIVITVLGCLWAAVVLARRRRALFSPERGGPLALGVVVEPLLWISLLVFVPLALFGTPGGRSGGTPVWTTALRVMLLVATACAAVVRLGPSWLGPIANGASASASGQRNADRHHELEHGGGRHRPGRIGRPRARCPRWRGRPGGAVQGGRRGDLGRPADPPALSQRSCSIPTTARSGSACSAAVR